MASAGAAVDGAMARTSMDKQGELPPTLKTESSGNESAYQSAVAAWRNIDLTSLQKSLDNSASEIVSSQRDSLVERKELAQKTKEFRKMDEEGRASEWKPLLKSYQSFIDHLTTQKKSTETAFLSLYSTLSEAPDPYPLLEATIDSLLSSEDVSRLSSENSSLRTTIARLTSQVSHLEARGEEYKRELERKDKEKKEELGRLEGVLRGVQDEKARNWEAKEKGYTEKIADLEGLVREVKASYEVAQRMGRHGGTTLMGDTEVERKDDRVGNGLAELEIVSRDLERTNLRLAEVESRNEQLRLELAKAASATGGDASPPTKESQQADEEDDPHLTRLQSENTVLMRKMELVKDQMENDKREWDRKIKSLEKNLDEVRQDKEALKSKIEGWRDYEEVRRELEILKSIEFSTGDDEEDDMLDFSKEQPEPRKETSGKKETLEQLLLARNKKLGNELTVLRVSHQDLTTRLQTLQRTLETTTSELRSSRELNAKLEDDLSRFQETPLPSSGYSVSGGTRYAPSIAHGGFNSIRGGGRVSPTSSIISGFTPQHSTLESLRAGGTGSDGGPGGSGILPMVTAQRDRFKQRNHQLEEDLAKANSTISSLRQEIATLQKDNMQLYEKTRYVSTYSSAPRGRGGSSSNPNSNFVNIGVTNNSPPTTSASAYAQASSSSTSTSTSGPGMIDRYRAAYEANISPFQAFRGRESARAMKRMGLAERIIYSFTRVVLANRMSRNLFAAYCVALHLMCLGVLYWAGTVELEKHGMGNPMIAHGVAAGDPGSPLAWRKEGLSVR